MKKSVLFILSLLMGTSLWAAENVTSNDYEARLLEQEKRIEKLEAALQQSATKTNVSLAEENRASIATIEDKLNYIGRFHYRVYFRAGYGLGEGGEAMTAFKAPGAGAKYRLGNEAEMYLEPKFTYKTPKDDNGVEYESNVRFSMSIPTDDNNNSYRSDDFSIREAYALARGVILSNPEIEFWAGERFYKRRNVHMNDFYSYNMSGYGGGIDNVPLGDTPIRMSLAWIGGTTSDYDSGGHQIAKGDYLIDQSSVNLGFESIPMLNGELQVWLNYVHLDGQDNVDVVDEDYDVDFDNADGGAITLIQDNPFGEDWNNRFVAQYGTGPAYNFKTQLSRPSAWDGDHLEKDHHIDYGKFRQFRIVDDLTKQISDPLSVSATFVYQYLRLGDDYPDSRWISGGIRPVYAFTDYFSLMAEAGVDRTNWGDGGELYKFTIAPQLTPKSELFSRPSIRLFFTYAKWSSDFKDTGIGGDNYAGDDDGFSVGMQAETWW